MAMAAVAAAAVASGAYEARKGRKMAAKGSAGAQQIMNQLIDAYGGVEGLTEAMQKSEERLLESRGVVQSGIREAKRHVSKTKQKQLAVMADTERKMQIARARSQEQALATQAQRGGALGQVSTAGNAMRRGMAADAAMVSDQAAVALGNARQGVEGASGAAMGDLALKGAAADAAVLGQMSQFYGNREAAIRGAFSEKAGMLAGLARNMPQSQGIDLGGLGKFMAYMNTGDSPKTGINAPTSAFDDQYNSAAGSGELDLTSSVA